MGRVFFNTPACFDGKHTKCRGSLGSLACECECHNVAFQAGADAARRECAELLNTLDYPNGCSGSQQVRIDMFQDAATTAILQLVGQPVEVKEK